MPRNLGINNYSFWIVTYVAIGTISAAYGLSIIGSTVGQPEFYKFFNLASGDEPGYAHTTNIIGALNGVNSAGATVGSIFQAWSGDYFGRKWTMQFGLIVLIIGGALCAGTVNMTMFIIGRLVAGIGSGTLACIVPAYQAEMATAETRGAMVAVTGVMYAVGYSLAAWLGYACYHIKSTDSIATFSWRFPLAVQVLFPLIVLVGSPFVPESPRWLLQQGHREKALSVVTRLQRDVVKARQEFFMIEKQFELDKSISTKWYELIRTPANR
ncbi:MFS transporter [Penicillium malachiteum]|nr:MFS transporter [Penicillium malachiteum]